MENTREITLSVLEDLIDTCAMEHEIFRTVSDKTKDPYLKSTLNNCVDEKNKNILKLKAEIERLGGKFEEKGLQISQKILEKFSSLKNDKEIIAQCEEIDDIVLNKYSMAMNGNILWEVIPLVAKQYFASISLHYKIVYSFKSSPLSTVYS
ncbi:MAG: DUF2383 domain-containing protein [Ignavibacteriaceae bacterium]|nr:DUF2383 domain-containing protein [Ignavibacteriaceae bacterium]